ncbi:MAG TPA: hypothetical protein VF228_17400 [Iamia sp.]
MANPPKTLDDFPNAQAWLENIRERRADYPSKDEIQAALDAAFDAGFNIVQAGRMMGISRKQFYQGKYDLTRNPNSRTAASNGEAE